MDEIINDFKNESKSLIEELITILEEVEGEFNKKKDLEKYGQVVDRIMGGAKSIATATENLEHHVTKIAIYAELCKAVGYKASQLDNPELFNLVVAILLDATEMLDTIVDSIGQDEEINLEDIISDTLQDRLRWVSTLFKKDMRSSVEVKVAMGQNDIDQLLKKLNISH